MLHEPPPLPRERFDAVLFDMDGVLLDSATLHATCWKQAFDPLLARISRERGEPLRPFDADGDYRQYVDGKIREDGVRDFLRSRAIALPEGARGAPPEEDSVAGIVRRKDACFTRAARRGVAAYPDAVAWLREVRGAGFRTAVVTASHHGEELLAAAGLAELFEARVDGFTVDRLGLRGKPAPDAFLEAARQLGVAPERAAVVEDAIAGVAAGRAGGFGLVIGVARARGASELAAAGADRVVAKLTELAA